MVMKQKLTRVVLMLIVSAVGILAGCALESSVARADTCLRVQAKCSYTVIGYICLSDTCSFCSTCCYVEYGLCEMSFVYDLSSICGGLCGSRPGVFQ